MASPGYHLTLQVGPTIPQPAPRAILEAIDSIEVRHSDQGRSGFQIVLRTGRSRTDLIDDPLVIEDLIQPFSRVRIIVTIAGESNVLMDGFITTHQFSPGATAGTGTLTLTGEDISVMMDREEWTIPWPIAPYLRVLAILAKYAVLGVVPVAIPPTTLLAPNPIDEIPTQSNATDRAYLTSLADLFGYVFYVDPGPATGVNTAYWGPPIRVGVPQPALTWNMGASSNVTSINFQHDPTPGTIYYGLVHTPIPGLSTLPVATVGTLRIPLSKRPSLQNNLLYAQKKLIKPEWGNDTIALLVRAQSATDRSTDTTATANGELDVFRYGGVLKARQLVELRGVGQSYDGTWYVKEVTHSIRIGEYRQSFSLAREGLGAKSDKVSV
ncbi:MAG: hypothetical protein H6739_36510 [Alphaproteobacteria bacterium]|nr:hypothetical protein [Alphaproteobacteria bacterium]